MTCKDEGSRVMSTEKVVKECGGWCSEVTTHIVMVWSCGEVVAQCVKCGHKEKIG